MFGRLDFVEFLSDDNQFISIFLVAHDLSSFTKEQKAQLSGWKEFYHNEPRVTTKNQSLLFFLQKSRFNNSILMQYPYIGTVCCYPPVPPPANNDGDSDADADNSAADEL
jgi:hypothetical protein